MSIETTAELISQPEAMSVLAPMAPKSSEGGAHIEFEDESTKANPSLPLFAG